MKYAALSTHVGENIDGIHFSFVDIHTGIQHSTILTLNQLMLIAEQSTKLVLAKAREKLSG